MRVEECAVQEDGGHDRQNNREKVERSLYKGRSISVGVLVWLAACMLLPLGVHFKKLFWSRHGGHRQISLHVVDDLVEVQHDLEQCDHGACDRLVAIDVEGFIQHVLHSLQVLLKFGSETL